MGILENAKPENCFYCVDGSVLRNILELEQKLRAISSRAFYHHVNKSRNDFGNWVKDVFHEHNLANELLKAKTPAETASAVRRHIRKAFLAEEEIESAIRKVVETKKPAWVKAKVKAVAVAAKKLPKPPKRKTRSKKAAKVAIAAAAKTKKHSGNRKLNKKKNKKARSRSSYGKRGKRVRRSNGGNMLQKAVKKQARQWLKWLSINPEP
jgi:hypothetical protein